MSGEEGATPAVEDRYAGMLQLADLLDVSAEELRARAALAAEILRDPSVAGSAELSPATFEQAEADLGRAAAGGRELLARGVELAADALMVRTTVLTYQWIDELQGAAERTLGSIAARAIGYLAPEVALGGAVVSAGLIETDALDRDDVATYLDELAEQNPELMDHVATGGGLLDGLRMRSLLTSGMAAADPGARDASAGLSAVGLEPLPFDVGSALRDVAGGLVEPAPEVVLGNPVCSAPPAGLEQLMVSLRDCPSSVHVERVADHRYVAYLPGPDGGGSRRLRLVGGDPAAYAGTVVRAVERAVAGDDLARVMLVGSGRGGVTSAEVAASQPRSFVVDQVVAAGAPSAQVPRLPDEVRMLALEDRSDPVALLGSLINAGAPGRVTVVFDGTAGVDYVAGGRAADRAEHPALVAELQRLRDAGYLA